MPLDGLDKKLLNALQGDFPLHPRPFFILGEGLGVDGGEVLRRIGRLKDEGFLRYIGPIFDARSLGYQSTLAAMQLREGRLDEAAQVVSQHPGVSHNYARGHRFNLWFTLALPGQADPQQEIEELGHRAGAEAVLNLPALRVFKLRAYFDATGGIGTSPNHDDDGAFPKAVELSPTERAVINEVQQYLPLLERPFDPMARHLDMDTAGFLDVCLSLQRRGVMRRFAGAVRHGRFGFVANAMACWVAPTQAAGLAGKRLAAFPEVSHCYERRTSHLWPYNLFAMIHGHHPQVCQEVADKVSREMGLDDYQLLFTIKEFKKVRVRYLV